MSYLSVMSTFCFSKYLSGNLSADKYSLIEKKDQSGCSNLLLFFEEYLIGRSKSSLPSSSSLPSINIVIDLLMLAIRIMLSPVHGARVSTSAMPVVIKVKRLA